MLAGTLEQKVLPYVQAAECPKIGGKEYLTACLRTSQTLAPAYYLHGLVGELSELLEAPADKFVNELGDVLWYYTVFVYCLSEQYGYDLLPIYPRDWQIDPVYTYTYVASGLHKDAASSLAALLTVGRISECYKKMAGHNKNQQVEIGREIRSLYYQIAGLAALRGICLSDAAQANVDKLVLRYPNGFSFAASTARADEEK